MEVDRQVFLALHALTHTTRFGRIEGVTIDLRHADLDPDHWCTATLWFEDHASFRGAPFIWFPWHGPFDRAAIEQEIQADLDEPDEVYGEYEADEEDELSPEHQRQARSAFLERHRIPTHFVGAGDSISVERVSRVWTGDAFAHPHDQELRYAFLVITREDGSKEPVGEPVPFHGTTNFTLPGLFGRVTAEKVSRRICDHFGIRNLSEHKPLQSAEIGEDEGVVDTQTFALIEAQMLWEEAEKLWKDLPLYADTLGDIDESSLRRTIDRAVSLGYAWANAEAELKLRPLAISGLRSAVGARRAGVESGKTRRQKAEQTWRPHALELATKARHARPGISQDDVVADIQAWWALQSPACPGAKTLKSFVSEKEHAGELPRRLV